MATALQPRALMRRGDGPYGALVGLHILVVDDEADARDLFRTVLEYCGALVTVAPSALDAMAVLDRVTPDAILTDVAMPSHDGYWLVSTVRKLPPDRGGNIPVIAITAYGEQHAPERTLSNGFHSHLRKPLDPWELCRSLGSIARRG